MKTLVLWYITAKMTLFVFCMYLFLPIALLIGGAEYVAMADRAMMRFISELYQKGCINAEQKAELEDDLRRG